MAPGFCAKKKKSLLLSLELLLSEEVSAGHILSQYLLFVWRPVCPAHTLQGRGAHHRGKPLAESESESAE